MLHKSFVKVRHVRPPCTSGAKVAPAPRQLLAQRQHCLAAHAAAAHEPAVPENIDLSDPELQQQIDAMLQELDPDLLMDDTRELITAATAAATQQQQELAATRQQQQQQQQQPSSQAPEPLGERASAFDQAAAWQEEADAEVAEEGLPDGVLLTRAEYRRKAAILVELMAAQQGGSGTSSEAFMQRFAAFRVDVDEAMLHLLERRLQLAVQHEEGAVTVGQLQELHAVLALEHERMQASPSMRLLDEVLDMLADDPTLPKGKQYIEGAISRLRAAFTGGVGQGVDVFAAAAALAENKALAADELSVEFVPQSVFMAECKQLLDTARQEMDSLATVVTSAQVELQQLRNTQPQLLQNSEAQQQIEQLAQADKVLQQRKAAVAQLALVLELASDLDTAQASLSDTGPETAAAALMDDPERLFEMLGWSEKES